MATASLALLPTSRDAPNQASPERFDSIEGLRAWLAWGVFFGHIILFAGLSRLGIPKTVREIPTLSVEIFIVISGFVITHLLISREEAYLPYLARRFFRLFPAYVICAAAGGIAIAISKTPWTADPTYEYGRQLAALQAAQSQHLTAHVLLHLTMLHGAVPNNILNFSQWALLPPAWSASLEWQFYLVAPFVLLLCKRPFGAALVALVTVAGLRLYEGGYLGAFALPSILMGSGHLFLLGIASRLSWNKLRPSAPVAVAIATIGFGYLLDQLAIGIWLAFFTYMSCRRSELQGVDRQFVSVANKLFSGRFVKGAGQRTYCVYLVHFPILQLLLAGLAFAQIKSPMHIAGLLLLLGLPLTLIASEAVHRLVELPGMKFGKYVASSTSQITGGHVNRSKLHV